ncbi:MAG: sarcosine oxidase subunit alpha family protein [Rhizobiales bacterium]|nr:sarcosine oxidase subunit alpha family protein [Hyphomicrobiales bacterium]
MSTYRLDKGGLIDRTQPVRFSFDGRSQLGFKGDTLASALIANGQHMVARSFKYHRPRGILSAGPEEPAAIVQIGDDPARTDPNIRVTEQEIYAGLSARSQNAWPSLEFDIGRVNDLAWRFLPAGFYYKTFMGPPFGWMNFEPFIRAAAGLGKAPSAPDPDRYEVTNRHCDVLIIGAGPAGLRAADAASAAGARVILCDEGAMLGGQLLSESALTTLNDGTALDFVTETAATIGARDTVTVLTRTTAFGYYGENFIGLWERVSDHLAPSERAARAPRERVWRVRAREVVLATGAIERPIVFHENDRPGIMLASAAQTYAIRYGVLPGRTILTFANNDAAWMNAFVLQDSGARIAGIADARPSVDDALLSQAAARAIPVMQRSAIVGTSGQARVKQALVRSLDSALQPTGAVRPVDCDLILVSGGYNPNVALFSQSRGRLAYDAGLAAFRPAESFQRERSAGSCNGAFSLADCLAEGEAAGRAAAEACGFSTKALAPLALPIRERTASKTYPLWEVPSGGKISRAWVDLQNDVTAKDLKLAVQEGYTSVEHAKRYTTTGMGTDQGKVVGINAFGILAQTMGKSIPEVGVTTYRQPYKPVTFGALAGQHVGPLFHPRRGTPMHEWHREKGAHFETVGEWLRAWVYPKPGESWQRAVQREAKAARTGIGILDASTLGKIDIRGSDAREFLNRVYTNSWTGLAPGRSRYGLMLNEDGMVIDDGVTTCLADDHFHMTTTTGGAAAVLSHLEDYLQTEWTALDVTCVSVTEEWAVASICGPHSPKLIADLFGEGFDPETMPFMSMKETTLAGIPVRLFRISFTGEISYEINIPADYGRWLWEVLMEAGAPYAIAPYGTETMHLLRAEKGFIIVGQETDRTVTPYDLRMDWIVSRKKGDFIGKRSLFRSDTMREDRRQLVGLLTEDGSVVAEEGAQIIATEAEPAPPVPMIGHITSSYYSPNLNRSIALALVKGGGKRMGETVYITRRGAGAPIKAIVAEVDFMAKKEAE